MNVKLNVLQVGPSVSVQDQGRPGHLRFGVTSSGVMDRTSFAMANAALDNPPTNPVLEISLGGIILNCVEGNMSLAIVGGSFTVMLNDNQLPPWSIFTMKTGDTLTVRPGDWGSWCYLAFAGELDANRWLDSYSVHLKSGVCGTAIQQDDLLQINTTRQNNNTAQQNDGAINSLGNPDVLRPESMIRAVVGPQERYFAPETLAKLFSSRFTISADYDRMGMRLSGCTLPIAAALDMPSEPIIRGSLQVPGHGDPICLLADHHTAGGYPKIATVVSADLDALSQHRAGQSLTFESVTPKEAVQAARDRRVKNDQILDHITLNKEGLAARLWTNNLISGASDGITSDEIEIDANDKQTN